MVLIGLGFLAYLWWLSLPSVPCVCQGWCQCGKGKGTAGKVLAGPVGLVFRALNKKSSKSKSEERAADLERQSRQRADTQAEEERQRATQLAIEQRQTAETERQRIEGKFARTPEETQLLQELRARAALPGEELFRKTGPTSAQLADAIRQRLVSPPQIPFESTLAPALRLAQDQVTNFAARRGITGSGIELESLGRAGVDLVIREVQAREQNRLRNESLIQETLNRAMGFSQFSSGLESEAIGSETDLEKFLRDQELQGVRLGSDVFNQGLGRGAQFQSQGLGQAANRLALGEQASNQFSQLGLSALSQREEAARQRNAAIAQALGSAAFTAASGGLGFIPGVAGGFGGAASAGLRSLAGLPVGQSLVEQLLNAQRGSIPSGVGQLGYHGAGYANYPETYRQLYGSSF